MFSLSLRKQDHLRRQPKPNDRLLLLYNTCNCPDKRYIVANLCTLEREICRCTKERRQTVGGGGVALAHGGFGRYQYKHRSQSIREQTTERISKFGIVSCFWLPRVFAVQTMAAKSRRKDLCHLRYHEIFGNWLTCEHTCKYVDIQTLYILMYTYMDWQWHITER